MGLVTGRLRAWAKGPQLREELRRARPWILIFLGLVAWAALAGVTRLTPESEPEWLDAELATGPSAFEQQLAEDPRSVVDEQFELAKKSYEAGDILMTVSHARAVVQAAARTIPEEALEHRRHRDDDYGLAEMDIWEYASGLADTANASVANAVVLQGANPDDHGSHYDNATPAWHASRAAHQGIIDAWEITEIYLEENTDPDLEDAWFIAELAWQRAAFSWDFARLLTHEWHGDATEAWWNDQ